MSENLDLVRSIYADWERGDFTSAAWAHPQIEYVIADGPEPGSYGGLHAVTAAWRDRTIPWADARVAAEKYRELDDERVLVFSHWAGRGKTSGMDLGQLGSKGASLFEARDRKVTRIVAYWDRDRALADLGLAPEGDPA